MKRDYTREIVKRAAEKSVWWPERESEGGQREGTPDEYRKDLFEGVNLTNEADREIFILRLKRKLIFLKEDLRILAKDFGDAFGTLGRELKKDIENIEDTLKKIV